MPIFYGFRETEIYEFDLSVSTIHDVFRLYISMNNPISMAMINGSEKFLQYLSGFELSEGFLFLEC